MSRKCPKCGYLNDAGDAYCHGLHCGEVFDPDTTDPVQRFYLDRRHVDTDGQVLGPPSSGRATTRPAWSRQCPDCGTWTTPLRSKQHDDVACSGCRRTLRPRIEPRPWAEKDLATMAGGCTMRPVTDAQLIQAAATRGFAVRDCPRVVTAVHKGADAVVLYADRDGALWVAARHGDQYVLGLLKDTVLAHVASHNDLRIEEVLRD